jgi:hypothetical protein
MERVRDAAINKPILSRRSAHTNSRQKQWSDHNYFFPSLQLSHINEGSVVLTLVMRSLFGVKVVLTF